MIQEHRTISEGLANNQQKITEVQPSNNCLSHLSHPSHSSHPSHLSHLSHNRLCGSHSHLSHLSHLSHNCPCMLAHRISPFEGTPRASAAEYVLGGMFSPNLPQKNSLSLTIDFQLLNNSPQKNLKKSCQKICRIKKTPYLCTRK